MEEKHSALRVTVSTLEGEVVDVFVVTDWRRVKEVKEGVGEEAEVVGMFKPFGAVWVEERLGRGLE
jgi:hypothetical protein